MTSEMAIIVLKNEMAFFEDAKIPFNREAHEMAIKALEELPKRREETKKWKRKYIMGVNPYQE